MQRILISAVVGLLVVVLAVSVFATEKNNREHMDILSNSVKSNLISISIAALELIDIEKFNSYNSLDDIEADVEAYNQTLANLRSLQEKVGATYIYALKKIDDKYYFVFDTDTEDESVFVEYDISPVHEQAFLGIESADIMNVEDEYGSFNTGAVPIIRNGEVIGIVSTDIEDYFIRANQQASTVNIVILILTLTAVMGANIIIIRRLVIVPISCLTDSVSRAHISEDTIYGKDRNDEIGELARKILHMTQEIERTLEKAQAANRAKSDFLANMSHEIRTPMNAIIGMTNIARSTLDIEKKDGALEKIEEASSHLLGIINDILDMAKIEAEKLELHPVLFDFDERLKKTVDIINFSITEKKQKLTVYVDEYIPRKLICDDQRLSQIIMNLLSNAVKFTPENGSINISAIFFKEEDGIIDIQFEISDTGIGMSKEQQAKIFIPFEQAESSTTRKYGGTGLGLALTNRLVQLMGGEISVTSELGVGSSFVFTTKCERAKDDTILQPEEPGEEPADSDNFSEYRVLLAEDVEINREIVMAMLEPTLIEIDCAENGAEAVRLFSQAPERYDIIFMDLQMPEMDGYEAARQIRANEKGKDIPIVAMTANVFKDDVDNCFKAGMNGHIGKPIDFDTVLQTLRNYLHR
jgi:signal transduction histidine kinase